MSALYVSELRLSHFRSHMRADVQGDGRPVALFGPNGAGKTNILEAVSLLSPGRGLRRSSAEDMTRRPEALGWKITAQIRNDTRITGVETWSEAGASRQVRVDGKSAAQVQLGRIAPVLWLVPSMDRLWIEGADGRRRFLDRATMSFDPSHAEAVLAYEKSMRERNRLPKDMVRDPHWYAALESQMAESGARIISGRQRAVSELAQGQDAAQTEFPASPLSIISSDGAEMPETAVDLAAALADSRTRDIAAGRTLVGPHRADLAAVFRAKGVPARDCSTGEQKALLIALILANARALLRDHGTPPLLLLDEVSAHLDSRRRAALYDEICALGAQAWMTGTGIDLFEELSDRAQYVSVDEENGQSIVKEINP